MYVIESFSKINFILTRKTVLSNSLAALTASAGTANLIKAKPTFCVRSLLFGRCTSARGPKMYEHNKSIYLFSRLIAITLAKF